MNYLSVCSGVEAATVAWHELGWNPIAFSEIEKFPSQVLAHHYPNVPNLGDMTKYKEWELNGSIDILVGGTPCQSFSVAGLRKGLDDPRGNLALTYVGILDKFKPKYCVWENVPGVLSSNGGRDFGSFLGALVELGYGFAYRVLDAQNFGVAQRRRRVFVVGCLGDWEYPAKVLFESESLSGNTKQSREKAKNTSTFVESSFGNFRTDDVGGTTKASGGVMGGGSKTLVAIQGNLIGRDKGGPQGIGVSEDEVMYTLTKTDVHGVVTQPILLEDQGGSVINTSQTGITGTLRAQTHGHEPAVISNMAVRRLTPVECERLQGFPDNYTDIQFNGKPTPDGPRYAAMGNSMAVPVMNWIGRRIQMVEDSHDQR